jgi:hypothetical protein
MFWLLNVPLMALFFLAMTLIPLWMVLKRPDRAPAAAARVPARRYSPTEPLPVLAELPVTSLTVPASEARETADIAA